MVVSMAKSDKLAHKSISFKIMMMFVVLVTIGMVTSSLLYYKSAASVRKSITEKGLAQAQYFVNSVDSQISVAEEMTFNLMFDRRLSYLIAPNNLLDDYELAHSYRTQQERLKNLKVSSSLISSAKIYLIKMNKVISDETIMDMTPGDYQFMNDYFQNGPRQGLYFHDDNLYLSTSSSILASADKLPDIFFSVSFDLEKIQRHLDDFSIYPDSGSLFYLDHETIIGSNLSKDELMSLSADVKSKLEATTLESQIVVDNEMFQIFKLHSDYLGDFYQYIPYRNLFNRPDENLSILIILLIASLVFAFYFSKYIDRNLHKPLSILVELFREMEAGKLDSKPVKLVSGEREFNYVFTSFYHLRDYMNTLIEEVYVKTNLAQRAEMKQLQAQINPHFLYNSFFSLSRKLKRGDNEGAATLAEHLGKYFRFLARSSSDVVSLSEEVEHARSYAEIQQIRFYDRIKVEFAELPAAVSNRAVPRLILQPIVENAFKYGLENLEENGLLSVKFIELEKGILIEINDNGEDLTPAEVTQLRQALADNQTLEVTGLLNIQRRVQIMFGPASGVAVRQNAAGGLCVELTIIF